MKRVHADEYIRRIMQPMSSGLPFHGTWRNTGCTPGDGRVLMRFGDAGGQTLEIELFPAHAGPPHAALSINLAAACDQPPRDPEPNKILRAFIAMMQLRDCGKADLLWPPPSFPRPRRVVDLSLCNRCLNQCIFCGSVRQEIPQPSTEQVRLLLDQYRAQGYDGVEFSSKEFALRSDAAELIRYARGAGFCMIHLVSSGLVFKSPEKTRRLLGAGVNKLTISLHSRREDQEARITGNPGAFQGKLKGIRNVQRYLAEAGGGAFVFSINSVLTPFTLPDMDQIMVFVADLGVRRHNIFFPRIHAHMMDAFDEIVPRYADVTSPLQRGLSALAGRDVLVALVDIPLCVLPPDARKTCARLAKQVYSSGPDQGAPDTAFDVRDEKVKGPPCRACSRAQGCEGVFEKYAARRGWKEFKPQK